MGLFDRKSKKDDSKTAKAQNEEERIKKELETLAAILDKSDSTEKTVATPEKVTMKPLAAAPAEKPAEKINILKPSAAVEKPKETPKVAARQAAPVQKPILKPNIMQSQPIPAQKPAAVAEKVEKAEKEAVKPAPIKEREEARKPERVTQTVAQPDIQALNLLKGQMERQV
jgi:hypothetical protein